MAGLLSKGITLGYSGRAKQIQYKHTISAQDNASDIIELEVITDSAEPLASIIARDPSALIGATLVEDVGGSPNCTIVRAATGEDGMAMWECSNGNTHTIKAGSISEETTTVIYPSASQSNFGVLTNLQEIAELGNNAREKIDVTVLSDGVKKSIAGLADPSQDLAFKFLYEKAQFDELVALVGSYEWRVTLPDGTTATFNATPSVKLAGVGVSAALTYTLTLSVESEIVFA